MKKKILFGILIFAAAAAAVIGGFLLTRQPEEKEILQMKLRGDRETYVECNRPYVEPGAFATVEKDGISQKLQVAQSGDSVDTGKLGTYLMKYTVQYNGRVLTDYRRVHVVDTEKPSIRLNGAQYYTMSVGQPYAELGCTATDNYDGDVSDRVQVTGMVDRTNPGEYILTYHVTDSYKNTSTVTRTVCVEDIDMDSQAPVRYGEPNGKVIYLTFDDGPGKDTARLLDVLKKYNVKATFFLVDTRYLYLAKRMALEGHALALHTTSHVYKEIYASEEAYFNDLYAIQKKVKDLTGQECTMIRFPGGSSNSSSRFNPGIMTKLTKLVEEKGFTYYDWTIDCRDSVGAKTEEEVYQNVISGVLKAKANYSIVLQHDVKSYSVDAVERIILWGLEHGYTFLPMDENTPAYHHKLRN